MISEDDNSSFQMKELRVAAIHLFGLEPVRESGFINNLTIAGLKNAFREKARRFHPDMRPGQNPVLVEQNRQRFIKVKESYDLLQSFLAVKCSPTPPEPRVAPPDPPPVTPEAAPAGKKKIIAVGGAKGGIGKSSFTANLGVYLAARGQRTVLVDLDLGGANLHLYLGQTFIKHSINDYFTRKVQGLTELMIPTNYGPRLIGGDSSELGSANISFWAKMKLIKSLRELDADYVLIDLGSSTTFNTLDFFLAADAHMVVTTCEPAAYLEAYNLIKVGLLRRLNRLFGAESTGSGKKNLALQELIHEATMSPDGARARHISELLARVERDHPGYLPALNEAIDTYQPGLVINKVGDVAEVGPIVTRIKDVSRKMLGIKVRYVGTIPYLEEVQRSTNDLIPEVARNSQGFLAQRMAALIRDL
jgi:flagellar biosynthesis protein FlhG